MEPNKAYNTALPNALTVSEAIYDYCSEPQNQESERNPTVSEDIYDDCYRPRGQDKKKSAEFSCIKNRLFLGLLLFLSTLTFLVALVGMVLCTAHFVAEMENLHKILVATPNFCTNNPEQVSLDMILSTVQNISKHMDEGERNRKLSTTSADTLDTILFAVQNGSKSERDTLEMILSGVQNISDRIEVLHAPSDICGGPGWRRVAFIDMRDPNQDCPQGLNETSYSVRKCGRAHSETFKCSPVTFPTSNSPYRYVCGRVTAYRRGYNLAFYGYHLRGHLFDDQYVDGISFTHGSPLTHIWTFASGLFNGTSDDGQANGRCPCDEGNPNDSPLFVGNDYFCESVATLDNWNINRNRFYPDDALWDGEGCQGNSNTCCLFNNPPWFKKTLPNPTSDDIEMRLCLNNDFSASNIGIELLELYIN